MGRALVGSALALILVVLLVGCGDSGAATDPGPSVLTSGPAVTDSATSADPTRVSISPSSSIHPADGPRLPLTAISGAFPRGYELLDKSKSNAFAADPDFETNGIIYVLDLANVGSLAAGELGDSAEIEFRDDKVRPKRLADRTVNGVAGYVLRGKKEGYGFYYEWGAPVPGGTLGRDVSVAFEYRKKSKNVDALIDSFLASLTLG